MHVLCMPIFKPQIVFPQGQTFQKYRRRGGHKICLPPGDKHFSHTGGGQTFSHPGGVQTFYDGGGSGYDDVDKVSEENFPVSEVKFL